MTDQPQLLPTRPIEVELAKQFQIAYDLGTKNLALQETVARLTKERDALRAYAKDEEERFMTHRWCEDCTMLADKCWSYCPAHRALGRLQEERRAALALCKEVAGK